jgi:hypothetical protein
MNEEPCDMVMSPGQGCNLTTTLSCSNLEGMVLGTKYIEGCWKI